MSHHHRAVLKQVNKGYKSKHSSKGSLKAAAKGKLVSSGNPTKPQKNISSSSKKARLNANAQKREQKRKETVADVKFFSTSSGGGQVPRIISVVPLISNLSPRRFLLNILPALGLPESEVAEVSSRVHPSGTGSYLVRAPRFKTNVQINLLPPLALYQTLDAALVSDYIVLLMSATHEVQLEGEAVLRCLQAQCGGVEMVPAVQAPENEKMPPATKASVHKSLLSFTKYFFPAVDKVHSSDTPNEAALLARQVCEAAPKTSRDDGRAYLVAEGSEGLVYAPTGEVDGQEVGRLEVTGTIRGGTLSADRLVHIPGRGDFQVEEILTAPPSSLALAHKPHRAQTEGDMSLDTLPALSSRTENADDLTAVNIPDTLLNEQTWPTEEEMSGASAAAAAAGLEDDKPRTKRVPKGTSAYQAAWIVDDDDGEDEDDDDDDDDDDDEDMDVSEEEGQDALGEVMDDDEETEEIEMDSRRSEVHRDLDPEQEEREYAAYLKERARAAEEDQVFPDEVDTPRHIPARTRFQRYRGLKSFRTSPWDPYENLPVDYAKIFQFENWNGTRKRIETQGKELGVKAGTRVTVVLRNVPSTVYTERNPALPFILHGLLQHEHKQSVLHFVVHRNTEYDEPVKAKDPLVLCVGPRRYAIKPVYSQHVRGGGRGVNNVHKSEKFLRQGSATVATCFGPITFGKAGVVLLRDEGEGQVPSLVAMGSPLPPDPTRIVAKRIVLTGHPFKIHKKTATLRYMFFNRDDVDYYKSVELHTKYGRVGHIKEPLGTHGYFKAHFDGPIQGMDTICMSLYKRQFPKWSEDFVPPPVREIIDRTGRPDGSGGVAGNGAGDADMDMD